MSKKMRLFLNHDILLDRFFERFDGNLDENGKYIKEELDAFKLKEVPVDDLEEDKIYVNIDGHSVRFIKDEDGEKKFEFVLRSEIKVHTGENMETLTPKQLALCWTLIKNRERGVTGGL